MWSQRRKTGQNARKNAAGTNQRDKRLSTDKRLNLPREPLNHRVRTDIFDRLDDERVYRRRQGNRVFLADIADEALHLGLLRMEKRRQK